MEATADYQHQKQQMADSLSYKKRFLDQDEWLQLEEKNVSHIDYLQQKLQIVLAYSSSTALQQQQIEQQEKINQANDIIQTSSYLILLIILCYCLLMLILYLKSKLRLIILIALISTSIECLHVGLFTPMLEIGAIERDFDLAEIPIQKNMMGINVELNIQKKFAGDIYFYYQSKSIMELIKLLFEQENWLVALAILLFSVIFPFCKTILMSIFVFKPQIAKQKWFNSIILNLSKWSMADVFVVAIFLGFLAFANMQSGITTYSQINIGLYFFFSYCILSIISSMLVKQISH